jgi:hypothetical protein
MKAKTFAIFLFTITVFGIASLQQASSLYSIPPTNAFKIINTSGANVTADSYNGYVEFIAGTNMAITPNFATNQITFDATSSSNVNTKICSGTDKLNEFNATTGDFQCSPDESGSGGETNTISNVGSGSLKIAHSKSGVDLRVKSLTAGQGITLTNGTDTGTVATNFIVTTQTCSGTDKVSAINTVTGAVTCATDQTGGGGGLPYVMLDNTVSCSVIAPNYCTIFTYSPPASSHVQQEFYLIAKSSAAGVGMQFRVISTDANIGNCFFETPTAAAAQTFDLIPITSSSADTGEQAWLNAFPTPVRVRCSYTTDASPTDVILQLQMETATTGEIRSGSYYTIVTDPI